MAGESFSERPKKGFLVRFVYKTQNWHHTYMYVFMGMAHGYVTDDID